VSASPIDLTVEETSMLDGSRGPGVAMAMRLVVRIGAVMGAKDLLPIEGAHIDSCLYHGQSGLDFVNVLVEGGANVVVPTTLNVSSLDLLHPHLYQGDEETRVAAKALMDAYMALGCEPTWTCAPYQREQRPTFGQHIAWAESNAIVFANSVLGARTHRYGDFIDIAAAVTGRVPKAGLHLDERRRATRVFDVSALPTHLLASDAVYPCIGFIVGRECGSSVPAIVGLPADVSEDNLTSLGAAAASSGSVAMFHAVGCTPEAPTLEAGCGGQSPDRVDDITAAQIRSARDVLSTAASDGALATVSLGTPHYSVAEIGRLHQTLGARTVNPSVAFYVSTGREMLHEAMLRGWVKPLEHSGVTFVTDTCTYITPIVRDTAGIAMTDSAKWAYYAPGNIGVDSIFASLNECVDSAVAGHVIRDEGLWSTDG
jgi:predicted aconitase